MIAVRRKHDLGLAGARQLAERIARRLQNDYGGSYAWKGNQLRFGRPGVSGSVAVTKDNFEIHVELGLLLSPLRTVIEREIVTFCDEQFGRDGAPERPVNEPSGDTRAPRSRPRAGRAKRE